MNDDQPNDPVDQWLREDARRGLADAGFTARVMAALPPSHAVPGRAWKPLLILGSTSMGVLLAITCAPAATAMMQGVADLYSFRGLTPAVLGLAAALLAAGVGGAILAAED